MKGGSSNEAGAAPAAGYTANKCSLRESARWAGQTYETFGYE